MNNHTRANVIRVNYSRTFQGTERGTARGALHKPRSWSRGGRGAEEAEEPRAALARRNRTLRWPTKRLRATENNAKQSEAEQRELRHSLRRWRTKCVSAEKENSFTRSFIADNGAKERYGLK